MSALTLILPDTVDFDLATAKGRYHSAIADEMKGEGYRLILLRPGTMIFGKGTRVLLGKEKTEIVMILLSGIKRIEVKSEIDESFETFCNRLELCKTEQQQLPAALQEIDS